MWFMSTFPSFLVYISIIVLEISFIGGGGFLLYKGLTHDSNLPEDADTKGYLWSGIAILLSGLLFNLMLWCYWTAMKVAIAIVDATADFFLATKRLVFVSIFYFFVMIMVFSFFLMSMLCIASNQTIVPDEASKTLQGKDISWDKQSLTFIALLFFALLWIDLYCMHQTVFTAMASCATYYFTSDANKEGSAKVLVSMKWGQFVHNGSIAFGSLILALVTLLKMMAEAAADGDKSNAAV